MFPSDKRAADPWGENLLLIELGLQASLSGDALSIFGSFSSEEVSLIVSCEYSSLAFDPGLLFCGLLPVFV